MRRKTFSGGGDSEGEFCSFANSPLRSNIKRDRMSGVWWRKGEREKKRGQSEYKKEGVYF